MSAFKTGARVRCFDRYRFGSRTVTGSIVALSDSNDGVKVRIDSFTLPLSVPPTSEPDGDYWFRPEQLRRMSGVGLTIGDVRDGLFEGRSYYRTGWNGKAMRITLQIPDAHSKMTLPYVYLVYGISIAEPEGTARVPWLASQTDLLASDWVEVAQL